jgi:hypothetical protein
MSGVLIYARSAFSPDIEIPVRRRRNVLAAPRPGIARSVHPPGTHPLSTLPRSVVLLSIVIARPWLVTAQIMDFMAHRPDYGVFLSSMRPGGRGERAVGRREGAAALHRVASQRLQRSSARAPPYLDQLS